MPATAAHRFTLEKYRTPASRHTCPECGKRREFTRYVDKLGEVEFPAYVGKCNREINCGYHYTPRQYFKEAGICFDRQGNLKTGSADAPRRRAVSPVSKPRLAAAPMPLVSHIDPDIFRRSLTDYTRNRFWKFLCAKFGRDIAADVTARYFIGSSSHWHNAGATVFWQIDLQGYIRSGKIILYDDNGHRMHGRENWMHSVLKLPDFHLQQCFFGEHLLPGEPGKVVAIVESEKTAVIASVYFAHLNYLWLACGGLNMLSAERCRNLQGRQIVLYPDTGKPAKTDGKTPFEKWSSTAAELRKTGFQVAVFDLLEHRASEPEKEQGADLADYLLRFDLGAFQPQPLKN